MLRSTYPPGRAASTASRDLQQLRDALASVRQSVDQLAAQLVAGQRQVADDMAKLRADEQEIHHKLRAFAIDERPELPRARNGFVCPCWQITSVRVQHGAWGVFSAG